MIFIHRMQTDGLRCLGRDGERGAHAHDSIPGVAGDPAQSPFEFTRRDGS